MSRAFKKCKICHIFSRQVYEKITVYKYANFFIDFNSRVSELTKNVKQAIFGV